ncbi:MAG TPA: hypothetical protein V6C95_13485 [Coleofasciculaceae cyanobacterium]
MSVFSANPDNGRGLSVNLYKFRSFSDAAVPVCYNSGFTGALIFIPYPLVQECIQTFKDDKQETLTLPFLSLMEYEKRYSPFYSKI